MIFSNLQKRFFTSLFLIFTIFLISKFNLILVYFLIVMGVFSILEFSQLTKRIFEKNLFYFLVNLLFISYIFVFCLIFFTISNVEVLRIILFILLFGCIASDIGGFVFGKFFKGPKLTKISPNKTYSGSIGSIIFTVILIIFLFNFYLKIIDYKILILALVTSIFCQLGDLFFSLLKRKAKLKDFGKILPGHGGVLDRLDGILFGIPFGFLTLVIMF